jgi:hypothetical protein
MDFGRRIQEAQLHVDQTKGAYDRAKQETGQAQSDYEKSITTAPNFQTTYEKYKQEYQNSEEIKTLKSAWEKTKEAVDSIRTSIDHLSESINQQFGGSTLSQAQRDKAKQSQLETLTKSFNQYNTTYQIQFADYSKKVDEAFDTSIDIANKDYDRYWNIVRKKFDVWQERIKNEDQWRQMYNRSEDALFNVNEEWKNWENRQKIRQTQQDFVRWQNNFAAQQRAAAFSSAKATEDWAAAAEKRYNDTELKFKQDVATFGGGGMSAGEFMRRVNSGQYAS